MTINTSINLWAVRLLLGALFCFGSEIILWTDPVNHTLLDWLVRIVGFMVLATLTLDIAQRYRLQDGFDAMVVLAGTAMVYNLLINPEIGWKLVPDSVLTRIIGGDALVQLILWAVFLAWMNGRGRHYGWYQAVAGLWLGVYWGFWMRWIPELRGTFEAVPLLQLYVIAGISFAVIVLFYLFVVRQISKEVTADDFVLSPLEWAIASMVLILLFLVQAVQGTISGAALFITVTILALCWLILWLRRDPHETTILDKHFPLRLQNPLWILLLVLTFTGAMTVTYHLPRWEGMGEVDQLWLMEIGTIAVGILWLPIVASVIATRAMDRYMREGLS
ncbi:MAG: hypothetical protein AAFV93_10050, partial [Chloroflexota bacterium]